MIKGIDARWESWEKDGCNGGKRVDLGKGFDKERGVSKGNEDWIREVSVTKKRARRRRGGGDETQGVITL